MQYIKGKDSNFSDTKEYGYVLAFLCPMEDEGISIWPTHRVIEEPKNLEENIEKYFNILPKEDFIKLQKEKVQPIMVVKDGNYRTLVIKDTELLNKAMPENCEAFRNLGVSILHNILIPKEQVSADKYIYIKDENEAVELAKKTNKIAIIVPATPVEAIKEIALNNENMPQKSTYFFPKLASGIVIHTLC